jgi:hypothetical protein
MRTRLSEVSLEVLESRPLHRHFPPTYRQPLKRFPPTLAALIVAFAGNAVEATILSSATAQHGYFGFH